MFPGSNPLVEYGFSRGKACGFGVDLVRQGRASDRWRGL